MCKQTQCTNQQNNLSMAKWRFFSLSGSPRGSINFWGERIHCLRTCRVLILYPHSWKKLFWGLPKIRDTSSSVRLCWGGWQGQTIAASLPEYQSGSRQPPGVVRLPSDASRHSGLLTLHHVSLSMWACVLEFAALQTSRVHTAVSKGRKRRSQRGLFPAPASLYQGGKSFPELLTKIPVWPHWLELGPMHILRPRMAKDMRFL